MPYDLDSVIKQLSDSADEKYRTFNESLIPGSEGTTLGVRMPQLRQIAKEICKGSWREFLDESVQSQIYEIRMLRGLVIASAKCSMEERLQLLSEFIPEIRNWAVCDCVAAAMKSAGKNPAPAFKFLQPYIESREEFELRFAVVMLMDYFLTPEYIDRVLQIFRGIRHDGYYVKMAVAWAVSAAYVKYPEKTLELLQSRALDAWTHNRTIQKCRESRRVSDSDKEMLLTLKCQSEDGSR